MVRIEAREIQMVLKIIHFSMEQFPLCEFLKVLKGRERSITSLSTSTLISNCALNDIHKCQAICFQTIKRKSGLLASIAFSAVWISRAQFSSWWRHRAVRSPLSWKKVSNFLKHGRRNVCFPDADCDCGNKHDLFCPSRHIFPDPPLCFRRPAI